MAVLKSGTPQDKSLMVLLRYLTMQAIRHHFHLQLHQFKVKIIQLLMHSLDSNFSGSDAW